MTSDVWTSFAGRRVVVVGIGRSGRAAASALAARGARVTVLDSGRDAEKESAAATLESEGVEVRLGVDVVAGDPPGLVVASPGVPPASAVLAQARQASVPVWSEVELAWHLRPEEDAAAWITVSGTNGKTTTLTMLTEILSASGADAGAAGNIGTPLVEAVLHQPAYDVLAVELSSFQLHFTASLRPLASCLLNVAPDHLDWHASWQDYLADKARVFTGTEAVMALDVTDPLVSRLANQARVSAGCRKVGYQASPPDTGMVGLIDGIIVDRAFADEPTELCDVAALPMSGTHNITNALAASTLARAYGVGADAVRRGLGSSSGQPHRLVTVTEIRGVRYVDDSKATNPHAARASILTFDHVVWIAGGLAKGADFDELVQEVQPRLTVAVLIGRDRAQIREALARHAPQVAVVEVAATDTGVMETAVHEAAQRARRGDTVLLAPACASMDLFADYAARGDAFVAAVGRLAG